MAHLSSFFLSSSLAISSLRFFVILTFFSGVGAEVSPDFAAGAAAGAGFRPLPPLAALPGAGSFSAVVAAAAGASVFLPRPRGDAVAAVVEVGVLDLVATVRLAAVWRPLPPLAAVDGVRAGDLAALAADPLLPFGVDFAGVEADRDWAPPAFSPALKHKNGLQIDSILLPREKRKSAFRTCEFCYAE